MLMFKKKEKSWTYGNPMSKSPVTLFRDNEVLFLLASLHSTNMRGIRHGVGSEGMKLTLASNFPALEDRKQVLSHSVVLSSQEKTFRG